MLRWLRARMGGSAPAMNGVIGALEEFCNPAAARAREELKERVVRIPSPSDKLLDEGKIVIRRMPADGDQPQ
jgi:hypothetical protein